MNERKVTVAVAGCGSRGNAYAEACALLKDKVEIVACADIVPDKLERFGEKYNVPEERRFNSAEEMLEKEKLADVMFICTLDNHHYCLAIPALRKGYHLLLEKPASPVPSECVEIAKVANEENRHVIVCHVLRYTPYFRKLKSIIDSGILGDIMTIQANEETVYWHQAHSFVRGNWRNKEETSPILLQKCCHDMDIFLWLTGKHCIGVSSFGALSHFKKECAPEGSTERCNEGCALYETCPYSVKNCYLNNVDRGAFGWPMDVVSQDPDPVKYRETLKTSKYGRCVYHCDNTVYDHEVVNLLLEDDLFVSFNVCAFTSEGGRGIHIMGTKGDLKANTENKEIKVHVFGKEPEYIDSSAETDQFGHGGGDYVLVKELVDLLSGEDSNISTSIDNSIESHLVALAADQSAVENGRMITLKEYTESVSK